MSNPSRVTTPRRRRGGRYHFDPAKSSRAERVEPAQAAATPPAKAVKTPPKSK